MRYSRRTLVALIAGSTLAGCIGDDADDPGDEDDTDDMNGDEPNDTDDQDPTEDDNGDVEPTEATVDVAEVDAFGSILVDAEGLTLYMFDADEQDADESACDEECVENWPPLTVEDEVEPGDDVETDLSTFERADGSNQVAANGWPLYYWIGDDEPGDTAGQAIEDVWWVLAEDGEPIRDEEEDDENGGGAY